MTDTVYILLTVLLMALITYAIRAVPLLIFRKKIRNKYIYSFLNYTPYAILTALTVPGIIYSTKSAVALDSVATTGNIITALVGAAVAVTLSVFNRSLIVVALASTATVFVLELILPSI